VNEYEAPENLKPLSWKTTFQSTGRDAVDCERTSQNGQRIAAAAAMTGLTRCVRLSLPWRPSKLRFDVLVRYARAAEGLGVMPMQHCCSRPPSRPLETGFADYFVEAFRFRLETSMPREQGTIKRMLDVFRPRACRRQKCAAGAEIIEACELGTEADEPRSTGISTMGVPAQAQCT